MQNVFIILIIFTAIAIIPVTAIVTSFFLKRERIKADALIKAEEIQAKNRLDIELLLHNNGEISNIDTSINELNYSSDERQVREKQR